MHVPVPGAAQRLLRPVLDRVPAVVDRAVRVETAVHDFSVRRSVLMLRISLGFVFIVFGVLKFFPGLSPAQQIAEQTTAVLTFHLVPVSGLLFVVAFVEVLAGILLIQGRYMRAVVWLLLFEMVAILSPLVTLPGELFNGPHHLPSLLGQYILKDVVLFSGVLVLAAHTRRGSIVVPQDDERTDVAAAASPVPAGSAPIAVAGPAGTPVAALAPVFVAAADDTASAGRPPATPVPASVPAARSRARRARGPQPTFARAWPTPTATAVPGARPGRTSPVLTASAFVAVGLLALTSRSIAPTPSR
ncbi:DoxX family protein [Patulibacter minatonensis]|uniref:DoxX family protein n=1 Tax=Patulibacter minatonensis TaxID=298163 RepID=UPI000688E05F|nr:DoxX family membrane protein [Patulibacter minatonensis]